MWVFLICGLFLFGGCSGELELLSVAPLPTSSYVSTRIIGGTDASIEQYPYAVQILVNNQLTCGGALLTRRHVLSAAHCFVDQNDVVQNPRYYSIRAGTAVLNTGGSTHPVSTIVVHESYNQPVRDNDVAILVLATAVTYSSRVGAASIPRQGAELADNTTVVHVGWGRTNANVAEASSILQQVTVQKVNRTVCAQRYAYLQTVTGEPFPVTDNMVCAGLIDVGGKDACQGDSGGPLVYTPQSGGGVVVGVTSWGWGCAEPLFPGVSARVASYSDWINATVTRYNAAPPIVARISSIIYFITVISILLCR